MLPVIRSIIIAAVSLALLWAFTIPIWHFPDEQAHFAQVQDYAEVKTVPAGADVSFEIYESTRLLGTLRDDQGRNQYTPVPGYQLPLSSTRWGFEENYLKNLPMSARTTFVKKEAPRYPPLYYVLGSFVYGQVLYTDLFTRLFVARLVSVLIYGATLLTGFWVAKELFPKSPTLQIVTTAFISFHPMLMFVGSGINNDVLMNLLGAVMIAESLALFRRKPKFIDALIIIAVIIASLLTKQLLYLLFPFVAIAGGLAVFRGRLDKKTLVAVIVVAAVSIGFYLLLRRFSQGFWLPFWPEVSATPMEWISGLAAGVQKLYRETFAWYWGVFRWLGLVFPLWLLRVFKVFMILSGIGLIHRLYRQRHKLLVRKYWKWWWLVGLNLFYIITLVIWDTALTLRLGFGHGLQGRYFFPLLTSHMAFLAAGLWYLGARFLGRWYAVIVIFLAAVLNIFALQYVLGAYYNKAPVTLFIIQLSQYKPDFAKWPQILIWLSLSVVLLIIMLVKSIKHAYTKNT